MRIKTVFFLLFIFSCFPMLSSTKPNVPITPLETQLYIKDSLHWNIKQLDTARDSMYMSEIEKDVVLELNMVRNNPKIYAELYIKPMLSKFRGLKFDMDEDNCLLTKEGVAVVEECIKVLNDKKTCLLLYPNKKLSKMSKYHAELQGKTEECGHDTPKGETLEQRIKRFKIPNNLYAEDIIYGPFSAREIVVGLLVDDGVPSRGHRNIILNNKFNAVGVCYGSHKKYKCMCVIDFVEIKE
ncbi:MAG: CAP domain-containing protein [Paludibacter sp.]